MTGSVPAVEIDTPVAAPAADASLLDETQAAPGAETPTESKPEGDKPAGKDGAKADDTPDLLADDGEGKPKTEADGQADADTKAAPETYEAFTLPDGMELDEAKLAKATPIFKDLGLDQGNAQKLVSLFADMQAEAAAQNVAGFNQIKKDWAAEIKADPDFGGDQLPKTLGNAKSLIGKYGDAALLSDLKEWGWGNHPGLLRMLARIQADLSEDTLVVADASHQSPPKSVSERLWPSKPQE